jgi:hypothetical protein
MDASATSTFSVPITFHLDQPSPANRTDAHPTRPARMPDAKDTATNEILKRFVVDKHLAESDTRSNVQHRTRNRWYECEAKTEQERNRQPPCWGRTPQQGGRAAAGQPKRELIQL